MKLAIPSHSFAETRTNLGPVLAFTVVAALVAMPILAHLYLPLIDLPNHIARHYLATAAPGPLDQYYDYSFGLVPSSAVDLFWALAGGRGDPVRFSQISIALASVGLVGSTMVLSRILWGDWSAWPAAVGLFAYHASFFWGFQNYVVSLPFVLLGTALWLHSENWHPWKRLATLAPFVSLLFLMHFFAFVGLAVIAFGREIQRILEAREQRTSQMLVAAMLALPFLLPMAYLVTSILVGDPSPAGTMTHWGPWYLRLEALASVAVGAGQLMPSGMKFSGAVAMVLCGLFLIYMARKTGPRLEIHQKMRGPLIALCALVLAAPLWLNGVAFVHLRFPILLAATLFAATNWRDFPARSIAALSIVVVALIAVRSVQLERYAAHHDRDVRAYLEIVETLPAGSRLLPVRAPSRDNDVRLWHIAGYAVVKANVFVPTLFQGVHGLKVREAWKDHSTPSLHPASTDWLDDIKEPVPFLLRYVVDWQSKYTHAIMLDDKPELLEPFAALRQIDRRDRFTLFQVKTPDAH